jgi:ABC-type branched-subunit amino acid transport system substrate-binding protein
MTKHRMRLVVLLATMAMVAGACGARVSEQQIKAAGSSRSGEAAVADSGLSPGAGDAGSTGSGSGTQGAGTATTVAGATATTVAAGATPGSTPAASSAAAPAGGNGGAVDVGVTATQVTLGNISTLSGPVPGLFQGAVIGAQAIVAYQNSLGGLFGRKFKLDVRDDQFDTGQNRAATQEELTKAFAFLGSFSLYDDAAVPQIQASGIPDVTYSLSDSRRTMKNNFPPQAAIPGGFQTGPYIYLKGKYPDAVTKAGTLYGDVPASKASQLAAMAAAESVGWKFVYNRGFQPTETDYTADIVRMKGSGVKLVYLVATDDKATARIAKAMAQQGLKVPLVANYMPTMPALAGDAAEGMISAQTFALFAGEDSASIPEVKLFNDWMQRVKPGSKPDLFAMYSWAAGRMLFKAMEKAGPTAKRADVLDALRTMGNFDSNGMLAPGNPGAKQPATCYVVSTIKGGKYQRLDTPPGKYRCDGGFHR